MTVKFQINSTEKKKVNLTPPVFGWVRVKESDHQESLVLLTPYSAMWFEVNGAPTAAYGDREYFNSLSHQIIQVFEHDEIVLNIEVKA